MYKAIIGVERYKDVFHEGDKAYLEGAEPTNETVNGQNANYLVISVRPQYKAIQVYFEKITNRRIKLWQQKQLRYLKTDRQKEIPASLESNYVSAGWIVVK